MSPWPDRRRSPDGRVASAPYSGRPSSSCRRRSAWPAVHRGPPRSIPVVPPAFSETGVIDPQRWWTSFEDSTLPRSSTARCAIISTSRPPGSGCARPKPRSAWWAAALSRPSSRSGRVRRSEPAATTAASSVSQPATRSTSGAGSDPKWTPSATAPAPRWPTTAPSRLALGRGRARLVPAHGGPAQTELLRQQVETNETSLRLLEARFRTGQIRSADILRQRQLVEATGENVLIADARVEMLRHRLAVLLGLPPNAPLETPSSRLPALPPLPATGLPAELVQRRPDVQSASCGSPAPTGICRRRQRPLPRLSLSATIRRRVIRPSRAV